MAEIRKLSPEEFPPALREIADPPEELYLEGRLPSAADNIYLTIVGSRRFSQYGREVCERLIGDLAGQPIVVVSGLAIGIDTIAHRAALAAGLATVTVPGSGLARAVLHPSSNRRLADEIVAAGGALLSEFPPDYPAGLHTFPKRNRLMAGLAKATIVIEAGERSGTLITARLALEYNRELWAVPGSIFAPQSVGTNRLIKQGAAPVTSGGDILELLGWETAARPSADYEWSPKEKPVAALLTVENLPRDELLRRLKLPIAEANVLLAEMEIKGLIEETLGEWRLLI